MEDQVMAGSVRRFVGGSWRSRVGVFAVAAFAVGEVGAVVTGVVSDVEGVW